MSDDEVRQNDPTRRRGWLWLAGVVILVSVLALFNFVLKPVMIDKAIRGQPQPPVTVSAATAVRTTWSQTTTAIGTIEAVQGVDVTAEVGGKVVAILFRSGQHVARGTPLARLDDSTQRADVTRTRAEARNAELTFRRQAELARRGWAAPAALDLARAQLDQARAQVAYAEAEVAKRTIKAPFAGRLGIRRVDLGTYVQPGQALVSLQSVDPVYATFHVPEQNLARLRVGQGVSLTVASQPGRQFAGRISSLESAVDSASRNIRIQATLPNPDGALTPGQSARLSVLVSADARSAVTVPETAVSYNMYGNFVYVLTPLTGASSGELYEARNTTIVVGEARDNRVEVLEGLAAGERVVTAGQIKIRPGVQIRINNEVAIDAPRPVPRQ